MVCNKITFVFVLVGLISISCMVSSATTPTAPTAPSKATTGNTGTTPTGPTAPSKATTGNTGSTQSKPTDSTGTTAEGGAGCPKITYGMLFSFISAILLLSA